MTRKCFTTIFALALLFIFSTVAVSAQQTRAVPPNDSFSTPKAIKIGKNYSVPDIGAATNQTGEPVASCNSNTVIPHSVWFSFSQPNDATVYLSTFGTLLVSSSFHTTDTVMAVYKQNSPGVFTEVACNDDTTTSSSADLEFSAEIDTTYYIAVGTATNFPFPPEATLKLITRMIYTPVLPPNYSFETPVNGADWKLKNGGDDAAICSNPVYMSTHGNCTFRFVGTPGVTTKLVNTMPFPTAFLPRKNALLGVVFFYRVEDTASIGKAKIRFIVTYRDGTPPGIVSFNITGTPGTSSYNGRSFYHSLKSSKVEVVKFEVKFAAPTGTLLIDEVFYPYRAHLSTRGSDLLPVPPVGQ